RRRHAHAGREGRRRSRAAARRCEAASHAGQRAVIRTRARRRLSALVALLAGGDIGAAELEAPDVHDAIEYRDILGNTENVLADALKQVGPTNGSGDRFAASTRWQLRWNFRVEQHPGDSCRLASAKTELDIHMTLPRWMPPKNASPVLVKKWNTFAD